MVREEDYNLSKADREFVTEHTKAVLKSVKENVYESEFNPFWLALGVYTLISTFTMGPIDFSRSVYNQLVGDTAAVKRQLVDYTRDGIRNEFPKLNQRELELKLANELGVGLKEGEKIIPTDISASKLWDGSEDYAKNAWQQWIWPDLD